MKIRLEFLNRSYLDYSTFTDASFDKGQKAFIFEKTPCKSDDNYYDFTINIEVLKFLKIQIICV